MPDADANAHPTPTEADALSAGLRRLVDEGTLAPAQAARTAEVLRAAGVGTPQRTQPRDGVPPVLVEVAGYAGGALLLAGAATVGWYLWGQFSRSGRIGLSLTVTVALVAAAIAVGWERWRPTANPVRTRLASTLGALGTGAALLAANAIVHTDEPLLVFGVTALVVAAPLFAMVRGTPLLFATWLGGLLTVYGVAERLDAQGLWWADATTTNLLAWGVMPTLYGGVWLVLGILPHVPAGFARHQNAAGLLGGLAALFGSEYAAVTDGAVGLLLAVLVVVACFVGFVWRRHWGYATAGVLCALIVPATALERMFDNPLAAATGLLIAGGILLGLGMAVMLHRRRASERPSNLRVD